MNLEEMDTTSGPRWEEEPHTVRAEALPAWGDTDQGQRREHNEDCYLLDQARGLYVICDGMGGMAKGELASSYAIGAIREWFEQNEEQMRERRTQGAEAIQKLLTEALARANQVIERMVEENPHWQGMGTTVVLGYQVGARLYLANVGDSRAYLCRGETITLCTRDDTIAAALLRRQEFTEEEARSSPLRNQLTSSLGNLSRKGPNHHVLELEARDRIILCSDGLWDMVSDSEIQRLTLEAEDPETAVGKLIEKANENGGHDNISVIAIFADSLPATETPQEESAIDLYKTLVPGPKVEPAPTELAERPIEKAEKKKKTFWGPFLLPRPGKNRASHE